MAINAYDKRSFAQYTPLSMQEVLMPAQLQRQRHDALDTQYAAINDEMSKIKFLIDNESDESGFKQGFNDYQNRLQTATEDLLANGINHGSLRKMMSLKNNFTEISTPIIKAYEAKSMDDKLAFEYASKGMIVDTSKRDLWNYAQNGYTPIGREFVDPTAMMKDMDAISQSLKNIDKNPQYREIFMQKLSELGYDDPSEIGMMLETAMTSGLTHEELNSNPIIQDIKNKILKKHGALDQDGNFKPWITEESASRINSSLELGATGAVGGTKIGTMANPAFNAKLTGAANKAKQEEQRREEEAKRNELPKTPAPEPSSHEVVVGRDAAMFNSLEYKDGKTVSTNYIYNEDDLNMVSDILKNAGNTKNKFVVSDQDLVDIKSIAERNNLTNVLNIIKRVEYAKEFLNPDDLDREDDELKNLQKELEKVANNGISNAPTIQNLNEVAGMMGITTQSYQQKGADMMTMDEAVINVNNYYYNNKTSKELTEGLRRQGEELVWEVDPKNGYKVDHSKKVSEVIGDYSAEQLNGIGWQQTQVGQVFTADGKTYLRHDPKDAYKNNRILLNPLISNPQNIVINDATIDPDSADVTLVKDGNAVNSISGEFYEALLTSTNADFLHEASMELIRYLGINPLDHIDIDSEFENAPQNSRFYPFEIGLVVPSLREDQSEKEFIKIVGLVDVTSGRFASGVISSQSKNPWENIGKLISKGNQMAAMGLQEVIK